MQFYLMACILYINSKKSYIYGTLYGLLTFATIRIATFFQYDKISFMSYRIQQKVNLSRYQIGIPLCIYVYARVFLLICS